MCQSEPSLTLTGLKMEQRESEKERIVEVAGGLRALNSWYFQSCTPICTSIGSGMHAISLFLYCLLRGLDTVRFMYKHNLDLIKKKKKQPKLQIKKYRCMFTVLGLHLFLSPKLH